MSTSRVAGHLRPLFDIKTFGKTIDLLLKTVLESKIEFDGIVCRGLSGQLIVPTISYLLDKPMIVVRKTESCHSNYVCEGLFEELKNFIIIDDCIATGDTIHVVEEEIQLEYAGVWQTEVKKPKLAGIFLYNQSVDAFAFYKDVPVWSFEVSGNTSVRFNPGHNSG